MSTDSNRHASKSSDTTSSAPLKASDFFPPGEGWNKAEEQDQEETNSSDRKAGEWDSIDRNMQH
jgi:hypothetical protein